MVVSQLINEENPVLGVRAQDESGIGKCVADGSRHGLNRQISSKDNMHYISSRNTNSRMTLLTVTF
jgi:hypothetical protein